MLDAKQLTWLTQATGAKIVIPLDLLPDPEPEDPPLDPAAIKKKKEEARDAAARKENLRQLLAEAEREREAKKQFALENARRVIEPLIRALRDAFDLGFEAKQDTKTLGIKHKKTVQREFIAKDGDVSRSGDVLDMQDSTLMKGGKKLSNERPSDKDEDFDQEGHNVNLSESEKIALAAQKAYGVLRGLQKELLAETADDLVPNKDGTALVSKGASKLFTIDEITAELFDPLVRSKVLPDAFIEDAYSSTQKMLDATNKLYKADLTDPSKFTSRGLADMGKGLVDMASNLTKCVLESTGVMNAGDIRPGDILTGATELAKLVIDTGDAIDTARRSGKFDKKGLTGLIDQLPDMAGQIVGAATGSTALQKTVTASATAAADLADAVIMRSYDDTSKSLGDFLGSLAQSILAGLSVPGNQSTDSKNKSAVANDVFKLFSKAMKAGTPTIAKLLVTGQFAKARGAFARLCLDAASQAPGLATDIQVLGGATKDNVSGMVSGQSVGLGSDTVTGSDGTVTHNKSTSFTDEQNAESIRNTELQGASDSTAGSTSKTMSGAIDKTNPKDPSPGTQPKSKEQIEAQKKLDELRKQYKDEEETSLKDEIEADAEAELEAFKKRMRGDDKTSRNQNTIDKMIADLKRDQAIMATLIAVGSGGVAIAGKFVAAVAVGTEAIQLAANAKLAYEKMRAAYEFNEELKSARETASAYGTAIDNFFANQKFQLTAASINVAMNGVKLIIAAVATAVPHAAPAVPAAAALSSGVNAVIGGIKQSKLKKSWQATKVALANPKNRRLGLKARKMNPTLAKYTIAYGATEAKDPIAVSMALACGLNEQTLKNPSTNVAKVKQYMETRFPDDGTVTGHWEDEEGWEDKLPEPKLDPATLGKLYKVVGEKFEEVGYVPPGSLSGLVVLVAKKLPDNATVADWTERSELLKQLDDAFTEAGKGAAKASGSTKLATVFAEFSDLAAEAAFEAWSKTVPATTT